MKNIYIVIIIAFFCLAFKGGDLHSIHISISEVDYFSEKKEIQVALKIYTDDLEASIKKGGVSSLGFGLFLSR